jgi:acetyl-CoA carboxylase biotin carboxyl carrier protein
MERTVDRSGQAHGASSLAEVAAIVRQLGETMRLNGLTKLDLAVGEVTLRLRAGAPAPIASTLDGDLPLTHAVQVSLPDHAVGHVVTAPMVGIFYSSPAPGQPPFAQPGDRVETGQTIAIIEAMKIMNEIVTDRAGTVAEVIAKNGEAVEYGSPLVRIIPDGAPA